MPENRMTTESPVARNAVVSPKGGEELAALVEVFTADQSDENFVAVLDYLHDIDVIIPMTDVDEDEGHGIADAEIGDIITEEGKRLTPEVLEDPSGDQAFPVYATEAEIQKDYDDTFTFVTVPFMGCSLSGLDLSDAGQRNQNLFLAFLYLFVFAVVLCY